MDKDFHKLRELILNKEINELNNIISRVEKIEDTHKKDILIDDLSKIITDILSKNIKNNPTKLYSIIYPFVIKGLKEELNGSSNGELSKTLAPIISSSMKEQVHQQKDSIVDALYPIMGNMISKYVTNAFKEMMVDVNHKLQDTLSSQTIKRKIKSKIYNISEAELILKESNIAKVNSIFLIHKESGMLILDIHRDNNKIEEPEMVASMLSAIKSFINDWISSHDKMSEVSEIEYGNSSIIIESAGSSYLAVVIEGNVDFKIKEQISLTLTKVILNYSSMIANYDGDPDTIEKDKIVSILSTLFNTKEKKIDKNNNFPIFSTIILMIFILIPLSWNGYNYYKEYLIEQKEKSIISLIEENNIKVYDFKIETIYNKVRIDGVVLNQKDNLKLSKILSKSNIKNNINSLDYDFLEKYIQIQLNQILFDFNNKYSSNITYKVDKYSNISFKGSIITKKAKLELINYLGKIFQDYKLTFNIQVLPKLKNRVYFDIASSQIKPQYIKLLDDIANLVETHNSYNIKITGYTDIIGNSSFNKILSSRRAYRVRNELIKRGININSIIITNQATPPKDISNVSKERELSRCVGFNWEMKKGNNILKKLRVSTNLH